MLVCVMFIDFIYYCLMCLVYCFFRFIVLFHVFDLLLNKFLKWKESFERKGLTVNLGRAEVMVSGGVIQDCTSKSDVGQCRVCLRVKDNSVLFVQCGKWIIHGRCAGVKRVLPKFSRNFTCRKCEGNIGEAGVQEVKL